MDFKEQEPDTRRKDGSADIEVTVDRLTGTMRVDPGQLLRNPATQDLLERAKCVEGRIKPNSSTTLMNWS